MRTVTTASRSCRSANTSVNATKNGATIGKLADVTVAPRQRDDRQRRRVGAITLEEIQVLGTRIVTAVDVKSTESATNITREELERLPVERDSVGGRAAGAGPDQGRRVGSAASPSAARRSPRTPSTSTA